MGRLFQYHAVSDKIKDIFLKLLYLLQIEIQTKSGLSHLYEYFLLLVFSQVKLDITLIDYELKQHAIAMQIIKT